MLGLCFYIAINVAEMVSGVPVMHPYQLYSNCILVLIQVKMGGWWENERDRMNLRVVYTQLYPYNILTTPLYNVKLY